MMKRVLLVAPRSNLLSVDAEIEDILRSGLDIDPLIGHVTASSLIRRIRDNEDAYDILWLAAHGNSEGVQLSDNVILSASELVQQVRGRFSLVVLNTCSSLTIAQLLQEEANVGVICTLIDIPDKLAYQTGSRLSSALAESTTVLRAYKDSKPGHNRSYLYLPAFEPASDLVEKLLAEISNLRTEMQIERDRERRQERRWWLIVAILLIAFYPAAWLIMWQIVTRL